MIGVNNMADLRLAVKREYFEQIKKGEKAVEYRLYNDYWRNRLFDKNYDTVTITLGYPKSDDTDRMLVFPFRGGYITTIIHKHFGENPVAVFAIRLGA